MEPGKAIIDKFCLVGNVFAPSANVKTRPGTGKRYAENRLTRPRRNSVNMKLSSFAFTS